MAKYFDVDVTGIMNHCSQKRMTEEDLRVIYQKFITDWDSYKDWLCDMQKAGLVVPVQTFSDEVLKKADVLHCVLSCALPFDSCLIDAGYQEIYEENIYGYSLTLGVALEKMDEFPEPRYIFCTFTNEEFSDYAGAYTEDEALSVKVSEQLAFSWMEAVHLADRRSYRELHRPRSKRKIVFESCAYRLTFALLTDIPLRALNDLLWDFMKAPEANAPMDVELLEAIRKLGYDAQRVEPYVGLAKHYDLDSYSIVWLQAQERQISAAISHLADLPNCRMHMLDLIQIESRMEESRRHGKRKGESLDVK